MAALADAKAKTEGAIRHFNQKGEQYEQEFERDKQSIATQESIVTEATNLAEEECERVEVTKSIQELQSEIQVLEARIKEKESEYY
jgi:chromosome segregation ATPase